MPMWLARLEVPDEKPSHDERPFECKWCGATVTEMRQVQVRCAAGSAILPFPSTCDVRYWLRQRTIRIAPCWSAIRSNSGTKVEAVAVVGLGR